MTSIGPYATVLLFAFAPICGLPIEQRAVGQQSTSQPTRCPFLWCNQTPVASQGISETRDPLDENAMQSIWAYPTYKPIAWEHYYTGDYNERVAPVSSGAAAGIAIGVFLIVFMLTFVCRAYATRDRTLDLPSSDEPPPFRFVPPSTAAVWMTHGCPPPGTAHPLPLDPPPPYELALRMPIVSRSDTTVPAVTSVNQSPQQPPKSEQL